MKKGRLFGKFYLEALRQTRVVGIIFTVIMSIVAFAVPFGIFLDAKIYAENHGFDDVTASIVNFSDLNVLFPILTYIMAPLMVLMCFSFLNKRASSDFYHSATQTRSTVFLAFSLSAITWILIAAVSSIITGLIVPLFCPDYFIINWYSFIEIARRLIASLYVVAATTLAMTLTGTLVNNILVTGIIIFVPRILMLIIGTAINSYVNVLPGIDHLGLLDPTYNLVFNDFTQLFGAYSGINYWAMLYTVILALIYFVLALISFNLRPSEAAGQSAPNRLLQTCYRILVTMVVCSVGCIGIFAWITGNVYEEAEMMLFELALLYIGALIVWFVYEIITTRKASNLLKTLPSLGIVVLLNVAIVLLMTGINAGVDRFRPEPEEIKYIRVIHDKDNYGGEISYSLAEYMTGDFSDVKITDSAAREMVSKALVKSLDDSYKSYEEVYRMTVAIATKHGEVYRNVYIPYSDYQYVQYALNSVVAEKNAFNMLPEFNSTNMSTYTYYDLNKKEVETLYSTLVDELNGMSKEELAKTIAEMDGASCFGGFEVYTYKGFDRINIYIDFSTVLKKTSTKYLELSSNDEEDKVLFEGDVELLEFKYHYIDINVFDPQNGGYTYYWHGNIDDLEKMGMLESLRENFSNGIDIDRPFAEISYGYSFTNSEGYEEYEDTKLFVSLDGIELPEEFKDYGNEDY